MPDRFTGDIYDNYDAALSKSKADLVYISTVNSEHAKWAERSLKKGFHVIIDKPSFTSIDDARKLEEERRLLYVAITRAKKKVYLSYVTMRRTFDTIISAFPSEVKHVKGILIPFDVETPRIINWYNLSKLGKELMQWCISLFLNLITHEQDLL